MKDVSSGKMLFFVPQIGWSGGNDDVDPAFLTDVAFNNGRNNIVVQRMCAPNDDLLQSALSFATPHACWVLGSNLT